MIDPTLMPPDITAIEKKILRFSYANIYGLIPDPLDKFIISFMFELGNSAQVTAVATGLSRKTIWERQKRVKELLKNMRVDKAVFGEA